MLACACVHCEIFRLAGQALACMGIQQPQAHKMAECQSVPFLQFCLLNFFLYILTLKMADRVVL